MSWAALDTTDRSMSLMKLSIHLCNCTFISLLFCQGSELAVESTLCTFQDLAVCAALVINSLAPTQNNKHGGLVPLLLCGSSWYSWVWCIQLSGGNVGGEMLQKEEEGGREGTVWCRDFWKEFFHPGVTSSSRKDCVNVSEWRPEWRVFCSQVFVFHRLLR